MKMWRTYWLMHHRPAGDPVGDWSIREEDDYGFVFLCLLSLHCAALRLCGKVRKHFYYCHFSRAFKLVVITFVNILGITILPILQDVFDSIYIHCEGFHRWRFPGCIRVHPWGENSFNSFQLIYNYFLEELRLKGKLYPSLEYVIENLTLLADKL